MSTAIRTDDERPALDDAEATDVVIIGAGPAGLTAAYQLTKRGKRPVVLEATSEVGGISRTVERDGWRFDIGGHRFFTKVEEVEQLWHELLDERDLLTRPRLSRIFYDGRFYDYPLKPANALRNLGLAESARCLASYVRAQTTPSSADTSSFEGWVSSRFGQRLYQKFFKTYTEKVWGVPADSLPADWAAQRIKSLSLGAEVWRALVPRRNSDRHTSLIERFLYPRLGPGMMWETCRDRVVAQGGVVRMESPVAAIDVVGGLARQVTSANGDRFACEHLISSMPLGELVLSMRPSPPEDVCTAARALRHRDFLTVALVVPADVGFPDNWIYIHSPEVRLGRVQNFRSWSPDMVKPGMTCLGLEYFVNADDDLWSMSDAALVQFAAAELASIGLCQPGDVQQGFVTRVPKAYPVYDAAYRANVDVLRCWLEEHARNVHPVGRNGMHRYNNQDHSMLTAMLAVENILDDAGHDLWAVNVDDEYHEEHTARTPSRTGRDAPITAA